MSILYSTLEYLKKHELLQHIVVFLLCFSTARLGQFLFFHIGSAPAVIWPAIGISFAAVYLGGYYLWPAISLAAFFAGLINGSPLLSCVGLAISSGLQACVAIWVWKKVGFDASMKRVRDAIYLILGATLLTLIVPSVNSLVFYIGNLTPVGNVTITSAFFRFWIAEILSVLVFFPLFTVWFPRLKRLPNSKELLETGIAMLLVVVTGFLLFGTINATVPLLYLLFILSFWVSLRLGSRVMALVLNVITATAIIGSIYAHPDVTLLGRQLFADELFITFFAAVFWIFTALVEERNAAAADREQYIHELQIALQKTSNEDRSKSEFIAILAHELRNPLAPIVSTLELLRLGEKTPEQRQLIESAEMQASVMRRLLDDLLDVARITQRKFKLQKETLSLQTVLRNSITTVQPFMNALEHELVYALPSEPIWLNADSTRLTQIFTNILYNAAKYTNPGGRIELSVQKGVENVAVSIADNGIGIPKEMLATIFEPFVQFRQSNQVGSGLGLGLSLTKRLVEMHSGSITVISDGLGKGSTFMVTLPLPETVQIPIPKADTRTHTEKPSVLNVLVVDDNEAAAIGLKKLLEYKGHKATTVHNGRDALTAVAKEVPHVVLLDIGLPDMSGYDVARDLRANYANKKLLLVALTGYGQDEDKLRSLEAGFDHHLVKPVSIADIETVLAKH